MDLLANSIAIMCLDDADVDEWMQMLRERAVYFCHGHY
jgi:hypothetical protein